VTSAPRERSPRLAATLLIEGGFVVTVDANARVIDDGAVAIRDGIIVDVGPTAEVAARIGPEAERIDARGCIVVPGFVNTHQHLWYGLFKGLGGGLLLERWVEQLLLPTAASITAADAAVSSYLCAFEMLASGTTTCLDHSVTATDTSWVDGVLRAVDRAGIRTMYCKEIRPSSAGDPLATAEEVHARWHGAAGGRIGIGFVVESTAHWVAARLVSEDLILGAHGLATNLGTRLSNHTAGGTMAVEFGYLESVRRTGRTDIGFLHGLGVLDDRWVLAHALNVRDRDIELLACSGAGVAHTPTSESCRGGGIAPVRRMRGAGVPVALGSDGPMVDTSVDMIEQMKVALMLQNQLHLDPAALTPYDVLAMGTIEGARIMGLEDQIGSLEPGKRADIAVFDLDGPGDAVWHDPIAALVLSKHGTDAVHVLVDGELLVRDGTYTRLDAAELAALAVEARCHAVEAAARAGIDAPKWAFR
jgi:5-methylthioadenosine/S-adenosylhomocysteine deaminase